MKKNRKKDKEERKIKMQTEKREYFTYSINNVNIMKTQYQDHLPDNCQCQRRDRKR